MKILGQDQLDKIVEYLNNGVVVAVPTETVYGLAVKFDNLKAIDKLTKLKDRGFDSGKVFSLMLANIDDVKKYAILNEKAKEIIEKYFPGDLTVVLKKNPVFVNPYFDNYQTIGIRIPDHKFMIKLLQKAGPLIVTSANKKGLAPSLNSKLVGRELPEIEVIVSGKAGGRQPSTVVGLTESEPKILRRGRIII
jgi:L-threonylcarbamoyladenylate synthase